MRGRKGETVRESVCSRVCVVVGVCVYTSESPPPAKKKKKKPTRVDSKNVVPQRTTPPLRDATPDACHAHFSALAVAQGTSLVQSHVSMCHVPCAPLGRGANTGPEADQYWI